jgi:hypothetical protein
MKSSITDIFDKLGNYRLQIGQSTLKSLESSNLLYSSGSRLVDLGFSTEPNENINNFLKDKKDIVICKRLSLDDDIIYKETGNHIYDTDDSILENTIDKVFNKQLSLYNMESFPVYIVSDLFSKKYYKYIEDEMLLYSRILSVLQSYKAKGLIQHLGFSITSDYSTLETFIQSLPDSLSNDIDIALVPFNILSYNSDNKNIYKKSIKDSPGERGIDLLKSKGYVVISTNPFEGGVINDIKEDYNKKYSYVNLTVSNYKTIFDCKNIDFTFLGSNSKEHIENILYIYYAKIAAIRVKKFLSD